jgi:hypothetical protein
VLRVGDELKLGALVRSSTVEAGLAQRARIVLLAAEGLPNAEIARRVGMTRPTVIQATGMRPVGSPHWVIWTSERRRPHNSPRRPARPGIHRPGQLPDRSRPPSVRIQCKYF